VVERGVTPKHIANGVAQGSQEPTVAQQLTCSACDWLGHTVGNENMDMQLIEQDGAGHKASSKAEALAGVAQWNSAEPAQS
jgi:hypothetical protein